MADNKYMYEVDVMGLPPLRMVLNDMPAVHTNKWYQTSQKQQKLDREMEGTVKRLIEHLKKDGKKK
jgi:hypothetical protein